MKKAIRVLIIEDSEDDALLLVRRLIQEGYAPIYEIEDTREKFLAALERPEWDIIISDYYLPGFTGLEALKILREKGIDTPCMIVSGKIDDETAVAAMKAGARDYIMKSNLKRLSAAIERELGEAEVRAQRDAAEKNAGEKERFNSLLLEHAPNPIILTNPDTSIRYVNPAFESLTGFKNDEVKGVKAPFPWYPSEKIEQYMEFDNRNRGRNLDRMERCYRKKNGELFWVYLSITALKDNGKVRFYLSNWVDITDQKKFAAERENFTRKLIGAQEEERKRISRELHDDIAQSLAVLKLEMESLLTSAKIKDEKTVVKLKNLLKDTERAMQDVRRYSHELRPGILDYFGLEETLEQMVSEVSERYGIDIDFDVSGSGKRLPEEIELALFRIAQEALNNVCKHSGASKTVLQLSYYPGKVYLLVADNGRGFCPEDTSPARRSSLGLVGMRERAHLIGAELKISSTPGKGTTVSVEVPLQSSGAL